MILRKWQRRDKRRKQDSRIRLRNLRNHNVPITGTSIIRRSKRDNGNR